STGNEEHSPTKRTTAQIRHLILDFAEQDERVRAVILTGSRADLSIPKDEFQDFDLCFVINGFSSFIDHRDWIGQFGSRIILQCPADMNLPGYSPEPANRFSYLMLFRDGIRIDLTLAPADDFDASHIVGRPFEIWLDKDERIKEIEPSPSLRDAVSLPGEKMFRDVCNEFWWVSTNVAKGLARRDIVYAKRQLETILRPMLMHMIDWQIAAVHGEIVKQKRDGWLKANLTDSDYNKLLRTYAGTGLPANWDALFQMTSLFSKLSCAVLTATGFSVSMAEAVAVENYLAHLWQSTDDAAKNPTS
ncbi:MAG TPA: aminoglycoside 6-adenylyltransferase, partial [Chitinophagaceae bacterium]